MICWNETDEKKRQGGKTSRANSTQQSGSVLTRETKAGVQTQQNFKNESTWKKPLPHFDMKKVKSKSRYRNVFGEVGAAIDVVLLSPVRTKTTSFTSGSVSDSFPRYMKISKKSKLCTIIRRKAG